MKIIGGLNQFSAAANLTLSQHFLEKKKKKHCPFILFNKAMYSLIQEVASESRGYGFVS